MIIVYQMHIFTAIHSMNKLLVKVLYKLFIKLLKLLKCLSCNG